MFLFESLLTLACFCDFKGIRGKWSWMLLQAVINLLMLWWKSVWELLNHGLSLWLITWGKHWVSCRSTGEGNSLVCLEGVGPGPTSLRSHLRADCHWGKISFWRWLPLEFLCKPKTCVSTSIYFWLSFSTVTILIVIWPIKYQPNHTNLLTVYLLIVQHVTS